MEFKSQITVKKAISDIRNDFEINRNSKLSLVVGYIENRYSPSHVLNKKLFNLAMSCLHSHPDEYSFENLTSGMPLDLDEFLVQICEQIFSAEEIEIVLADEEDEEPNNPPNQEDETSDQDTEEEPKTKRLSALVASQEADTPEINVFFGILEGVYGTECEVNPQLFEQAVEVVQNNQKMTIANITNTEFNGAEQYLHYVAGFQTEGVSPSPDLEPKRPPASIGTVADFKERRKQTKMQTNISPAKTKQNKPPGQPPVAEGPVGSVKSFTQKTNTTSSQNTIESMNLEQSLEYLEKKSALDAYDLREWANWQADKYSISTAVISMVEHLISILRAEENSVEEVDAHLFVTLMDKWRDRYVRRFYTYDGLISDYTDETVTKYLKEWIANLDDAEKVRPQKTKGPGSLPASIMTERGQKYAKELDEKWKEAKENRPSEEKKEKSAKKILEQLYKETVVSSDEEMLTASNSNGSASKLGTSSQSMKEPPVNPRITVSEAIVKAKETYHVNKNPYLRTVLGHIERCYSENYIVDSSLFELAMSCLKSNPGQYSNQTLSSMMNSSEELDELLQTLCLQVFSQEEIDAITQSEEKEEAPKVEPVTSISSSDLNIRATLSRSELLKLLQTAIDNGMLDVEMLETLADDSGVYRLQDLTTENGDSFELEFKRTQLFSPNSIKTRKEELRNLEKLWDQGLDMSKHMS